MCFVVLFFRFFCCVSIFIEKVPVKRRKIEFKLVDDVDPCVEYEGAVYIYHTCLVCPFPDCVLLFTALNIDQLAVGYGESQNGEKPEPRVTDHERWEFGSSVKYHEWLKIIDSTLCFNCYRTVSISVLLSNLSLCFLNEP